MLDEFKAHTTRASSERILAHRIMQLAADSDRVGLHREATMLASVATSVLEGRRVAVYDA